MTRAQPVLCEEAERTSAYALGSVPIDECAAVEMHLAACSECRGRLEMLQSIVDALAFWPGDLMNPPETLRKRLALRIATESASEARLSARRHWTDPEWEQVAPGIMCKLLATDAERERVSMLVRLAPGAAYPPHTHAGCEELHLLDGELWIEDRKLLPGDYNRAERGTSDQRVWSETGCTCVLITSTRDEIAPAASP